MLVNQNAPASKAALLWLGQATSTIVVGKFQRTDNQSGLKITSSTSEFLNE